jgi:WD40 repeat protein
LNGHTDNVNALEVLKNGNLVSGSDDNFIFVWYLGNKSVINKYDAGAKVLCLKLLDSGYLATGDDDFKIKIWDLSLSTWLPIKIISGHSSYVLCLEVLQNGDLASGSADKTIKVWNTTTFSLKYNLTQHDGSVNALKLLPNGDLASGSTDSRIIIWDTTNQTCVDLFMTSFNIYALELLSKYFLSLNVFNFFEKKTKNSLSSRS